MGKKSRKDIIEEYTRDGWLDDEDFAFYQLPHEEKAKREVFETFCQKKFGGKALVLSDDEICDNKELVLLAKKYRVFNNYHLLSERLLNDPDVALAYADCNSGEYANFSMAIRKNVTLMREAVKINPNIYQFLPVCSKADREIIYEVARTDPWQLKYLNSAKASLREPYQNDKKLALLAAKRRCPHPVFDFFALSVASDPDVLEILLSLSDPKKRVKNFKEYPWVLKHVDSKYWIDDIRLVKRTLRECSELLASLPDSLRDDKDVVMAALQWDSEEILSYASERLRADYDVVLRAVTVDALNLQYASDELRDNREIVLRAVRTYGGVLEDASERLQQDAEIREVAMKNM